MAKTQSESEVVNGEVFGPAPPRRGRRRHHTVEEKRRLVEEANAPGGSISAVARKYGVSTSLRFRWRRLAEEGALEAMGADEAVVPESEVKQLRSQIRELQRLLGKKTLECEILKEAVELTRAPKNYCCGRACRIREMASERRRRYARRCTVEPCRAAESR